MKDALRYGTALLAPVLVASGVWLAAPLGNTRAAAPAGPSCAANVAANDLLQFDVKSLAFPRSCTALRVTLHNAGTVPKSAMAHNWVLTRAADVDAVAQDASAAGPTNGYLKPGYRRVIAATPLLGPGESTTVTVPTARLKPGEPYTFFCSFPGHYALMRGTLTLMP